MTNVYISGPMTGLPDFNRPAFVAAEKEIRRRGFEVLNPARHVDGLNWHQYMRLALKDLADADEVVMLHGWGHSRGANIERSIAKSLDIPVMAFNVWLHNQNAQARNRGGDAA